MNWWCPRCNMYVGYNVTHDHDDEKWGATDLWPYMFELECEAAFLAAQHQPRELRDQEPDTPR